MECCHCTPFAKAVMYHESFRVSDARTYNTLPGNIRQIQTLSEFTALFTNMRTLKGAIHSTKISGNFSPKLNGSVRSNRKSFEKTGPPYEVDHFSRSDRLEFWLNGSRPKVQKSPSQLRFSLPSIIITITSNEP